MDVHLRVALPVSLGQNLVSLDGLQLPHRPSHAATSSAEPVGDHKLPA